MIPTNIEIYNVLYMYLSGYICETTHIIEFAVQPILSNIKNIYIYIYKKNIIKYLFGNKIKYLFGNKIAPQVQLFF